MQVSSRYTMFWDDCLMRCISLRNLARDTTTSDFSIKNFHPSVFVYLNLICKIILRRDSKLPWNAKFSLSSSRILCNVGSSCRSQKRNTVLLTTALSKSPTFVTVAQRLLVGEANFGCSGDTQVLLCLEHIRLTVISLTFVALAVRATALEDGRIKSFVAFSSKKYLFTL